MRIAGITTPTGAISLLINFDKVVISRPGNKVTHIVPNHGTSIGDIAHRPGFTVGWGQFPDGAEVIYLYDRDDNNFGYGINLDAPSCSEWGYAPFAEAA